MLSHRHARAKGLSIRLVDRLMKEYESRSLSVKRLMVYKDEGDESEISIISSEEFKRAFLIITAWLVTCGR